MEAATQLGRSPDRALRSVAQTAPVALAPSPDEKGFFYPELTNPAPTRIIEAIGKIAGTNVDVECTIEGPSDSSFEIDQVPLLIAGGYFGPEAAYDDYRHALAERGKWAVTWKAARSKGFWGDLSLVHVTQPQKLASQTALGVTRAVTEAIGVQEFDGSGHSNGGQTIASLARHRPDILRTATFMGSVGMDEHNLLNMAPRLPKFFVNDVGRPCVAKLALRREFVKQEIEYFAANPVLTFAEMISAGKCNLHASLQEIQQHGIPVAAIQFGKDDFFPLEDVQRDSQHLLDIFHIFRDPEVRHTGPQEEPDGSAAAQLEVLEELVSLAQTYQAAAA